MEDKIKALENKICSLKHQLTEQQKMASLGMLTAGIAHEVQNPLNFVINFSKMNNVLLNNLTDILKDYSDKVSAEDQEEIAEITSNLQENMQKIQEHGERAISIIHSILLQSRGKENEFLPIKPDQLVHEYVWLSYHAMRANDKTFNVTIHEDYQESIKPVMAIPQDLCRAILNIMNNACYTVKEKADENGEQYHPEIAVKVTEDEKELRISIKDNGKGIAEEVKNKMFKEIITTKPIGKGTGLGMNITWDIIVNKHHGKILVDSVLGEGTTFTLVIPQKCK